MDEGELHVLDRGVVGALVIGGVEDADGGFIDGGIPTDVAQGALAESARVDHADGDVPAGELEAVLPHGEALMEVAFGA